MRLTNSGLHGNDAELRRKKSGESVQTGVAETTGAHTGAGEAHTGMKQRQKAAPNSTQLAQRRFLTRLTAAWGQMRCAAPLHTIFRLKLTVNLKETAKNACKMSGNR